MNISKKDRQEIELLTTITRITQQDYKRMVYFIKKLIDSKYRPNITCPMCIGNAQKRLRIWYRRNIM